LQTLLLLVVFSKWTMIEMQQRMLTTALLSYQTTNHHYNIFVKCRSSASATCVQHPQTLV